MKDFQMFGLKKKKTIREREREAIKGLWGEKKGGRGKAMWQMITMNESQVNSMGHRNYSILSFSVEFIFFIIKYWKYLNMQVIYLWQCTIY